jgi:hypothetical protein
MNKIRKIHIILTALLLLVNGVVYTASADHDERKEKRRHQKRNRNHSEHYGERYLTPVNNPTYKENCGSCHFVYQPELLPSGSWNKMLSGLEDHFGEVVELDSEAKGVIAEYLNSNAAERSSAKRSVKIMRCLESETPLRITEIPYIQKKHHEISPDVLKREAIGSLSNCSACHTTAEKGIYEDDDVVIPR